VGIDGHNWCLSHSLTLDCRHGISRIFFSGSFLRSNETSRRALDRAIKFWSGGKMQAHFFKHEGFAGAVGAWTLHARSQVDKTASPGVSPA
jgi:pantothenate kinase